MRLKLYVRLTIGLLCLCTLGMGADAPPPGWLDEVATRDIPEYDGDIPAVVLFDEETVRVSATGIVTTTRRGAIRVLQQSGDSDAIESIVYTTDTDRVRKLEGWLVFPSGQHKALGKQDVVDRAISPGNGYSESRVQYLSAADQAGPGTVFGFESVLEERSIFAQFQYSFQQDLPVLTGRFSLELPPGWTAESTTFNHDQVEPLVQGSRYTWELRGLAPIRREDYGPSFSALAPRLAVTYFPSAGSGPHSTSFSVWSDVASWLDSLSAPQVEPDTTITQRAEQLTAGAVTEWEQLRAIGEFAQGIKYVSIQMGTGTGGGYTPHAAPEVLRNLYGDCKDKTNLMRALLRVVGINSHLVAIRAGDRRFVREEWPSPYQFNHAIIALEVSDDVESPAVGEWEGVGRLLLFDPTDAYTPFGQLPEHEQDSWALIAAREQGLLVRVPSMAPEQNRMEREAQVQLSATGAIEVKLSESSIGRSATSNRALYRQTSEADYRNVIERWISRGAPAATVGELEVVDGGEAGFDLDVSFQAPSYAQLIAGRLLVFKPAIVARRNGINLTDSDEREHPVLLGARALKETVRIALPDGFAIDEKPNDIALHTEFGDYTASWTPQDGALVFSRELSVKHAEVDAADFGTVRDFFRAVAGAEQAPVVLIKQ